MKDVILTEIIKYLVPTVLSFIIGLLVSQFRKVNGYLIIVKWVARKAIIEECQFYLNKGFITPKEQAELKRLWNVYHKKLKGNGEAEAIYNLVEKLPVKLEGHNES